MSYFKRYCTFHTFKLFQLFPKNLILIFGGQNWLIPYILFNGIQYMYTIGPGNNNSLPVSVNIRFNKNWHMIFLKSHVWTYYVKKFSFTKKNPHYTIKSLIIILDFLFSCLAHLIPFPASNTFSKNLIRHLPLCKSSVLWSINTIVTGYGKHQMSPVHRFNYILNEMFQNNFIFLDISIGFSFMCMCLFSKILTMLKLW